MWYLMQEDPRYHGWAHEMKTNMRGEKIFSHTMCQPCHKVPLNLSNRTIIFTFTTRIWPI
jgi:cytochrome c2